MEQDVQQVAADEVTDRADLKTMGEAELEAFVQEMGQPAYRGRQLFQWLYNKGATDFESMTSLSKAFRAELERHAAITTLRPSLTKQSRDGTIKALFTLSTGHKVEAVLIPDFAENGEARRLTVCVSSQVGCAMGCTFCATGQMGFQQNLTPGEIYDQVWSMNELSESHFGRRVSNVVYMGMGEPMLNYGAVLGSVDLLTHENGFGLSPRRITISTVGLAKRIRQLADDRPRVGLAVSLHAPTDEKRSSIMPVNQSQATDLTALRGALEYYTRTTGEPVTYEYCMFTGFNDTEEDARRLVDVTRWAPSKVNLIMYNPVEGLGFDRTPEEQLDRFIRVLVKHGVTVTVRRSRGQDIDAACGQLAAKESV